MKKLFVSIFFVAGLSLFAGDLPTFVNLGFSDDSRYFLFGEHGVEQGKTFGKMWLVDVEGNAFVKNGVFNIEFRNIVEPGESSIGPLFSLVGKYNSVFSKYGIDYRTLGRPLYIRVNEEGDPNTLNFRDYKTGRKYFLKLRSRVYGSGNDVSSSFDIDLELTYNDGRVKKYNIGNPSYTRKGVQDYSIDRILNSSDGKSIVVVVAKKLIKNGETTISYMVETLML